MRVREYKDLDYISVELQSGECMPTCSAGRQRVSIPSGGQQCRQMYQKGYLLADRTVAVKVPLGRGKVDFKKYCRMDVLLTGENRERVRQIAQAYFRRDFRFQVTFSDEKEALAEKILVFWLVDQDVFFQSRYQEAVAGFADVRCLAEYGGMPFLYLAAVDETYRAAGTAISLYAAVFQHYKELGADFAYGRISSANMPVMNLYAAFGARFFAPYDIYIKC